MSTPKAATPADPAPGKTVIQYTFAEKVIHDVANPLATILMEIELLRAEKHLPEQKAGLAAIEEGALRLKKLIQELRQTVAQANGK